VQEIVMQLCERHANEHAKNTYLAEVSTTNAGIRFCTGVGWFMLLAIIGCAIAQCVIGEHVFQITMVMFALLAIMIVAFVYAIGNHIPLRTGDLLFMRKKAEEKEGIY
jgi:hypothetical protein